MFRSRLFEEVGVTHPHGAIFNLEWLSSQKVEPDRLKVATYRNYLSLIFIPKAAF